MITAIIRNKENTLVLELPHSIYDIYEKLQSIGIMQPPKQIPLTDNEDDGVSEKLTSAVWSVELHGGRLFGRIDCSLKEALTAEETEALRDWLIGQCSDGLCEGFEQQPIDTMDGELFVSFWNSGDDYAMMTEDEFEDHLQNTEMTIGGM